MSRSEGMKRILDNVYGGIFSVVFDDKDGEVVYSNGSKTITTVFGRLALVQPAKYSWED